MFNFEQIYPEKFADSLPIKIESYRRENGHWGNQQIRRIPALCRALLEISEDRNRSEISHHSTPNGCRMVQAGRYVLRCGTTCGMMTEIASVGGLFHSGTSLRSR